MIDALKNADTFTRVQVADLIARALRVAEDTAYRAGHDAGYRKRVAEENAAYPPARLDLVPTAREDARRVHRSRMRVDERYERPEDWPGGTSAEALGRYGWDS